MKADRLVRRQSWKASGWEDLGSRRMEAERSNKWKAWKQRVRKKADRKPAELEEGEYENEGRGQKGATSVKEESKGMASGRRITESR